MNFRNTFTMEEVETFWDTVAPIYEECNETVNAAHYQRFIESRKYLNLEKGSGLLNIWSRTGMAVKFIREKEPEVHIINAELSSEMIKIAQEHFPSEQFDKVNLLELPYPNECFDEILSLETLEHVQDPVVFLKELYRVLKPKGKLVLSTPPATAEIGLRMYEMFFKNHGEGPHKFLNSKTVKRLLQLAGFQLIFHKGTLLIPVGPNWLKKLGEGCIERFQQTFVSELGIRQFYVCHK